MLENILFKVRRLGAPVLELLIETTVDWNDGLRVEVAPGLGEKFVGCDALPLFGVES